MRKVGFTTKARRTRKFFVGRASRTGQSRIVSRKGAKAAKNKFF